MEPFGDVRADHRIAIAGAGIMSLLTAGDPIHPKRLLPVKPPVDKDFEDRLKRARSHAAQCHMGGK